MKLKAVILIIYLSAGWLNADVYSLRPGSSQAALKSALKAKEIIKDSVKVNGIDGELTVSVSSPFDRIRSSLAAILKDFKHEKGRRSMLIDVPGERFVHRYYILRISKKTETLVFEIKLPKRNDKADAESAWPKQLPPASGDAEQIILMPKRELIWATFSSPLSPDRVFFSYEHKLKSAGYKVISTDNQNGGVYMHAESGRILVFNTVDNQGETLAAVFVRKAPKK